MVTLKDISAACGVSIAAVSRALNDYPDISEERKQRIREMAKRMGYEKSRMERPRMPSHMVGLIVTPDAETLFYQMVMLDLRRFLTERGYDLVILSPIRGQNKEERRPGYLARGRYLQLDAVILISSVPEEQLFQMQPQSSLRELLFDGIPVISIGRSYASFACVDPDYEDGLRELFTHLCDCGIGTVYLINEKNAEAESILERAVRIGSEGRNIMVTPSYCRGYRSAGTREAYEKTIELLDRGALNPASCIVYGNGFLLEGGMEALWSRGIRIPQDVAAAFLLFSGEKGACQKVTCWQLSPRDVAEEAVELILREIRMPGSTIRQTRQVKGTLLIGETTAASCAARNAVQADPAPGISSSERKAVHMPGASESERKAEHIAGASESERKAEQPPGRKNAYLR